MTPDLSLVYRQDAAVHKREQAALVRLLGRFVLVLTAIPALFTPIGLMMGSLFWLWWTVFQALTGLGALAYAAYLHARSVRSAARRVYTPSAEAAESAGENYQALAA